MKYNIKLGIEDLVCQLKNLLSELRLELEIKLNFDI